MANEKLLNARELAEILDLSVETIWRYTREGRIPYMETGPRRYRYDKDAVLKSLSLKTHETVRERAPSYELPGKMTSKEFAELSPEPGVILQLIDGMLIREPGPVYQHQRVSRRLQQTLIAYFEEADALGEVFNAPLDLYLSDYTVVQPDLFYLPGTRPARRTPVDSLPHLIVEILSPTTARTDRVDKLNSYSKAGVEHYWLVDPLSKTIECLKLMEGVYVNLIAIGEGTLKHPDFPDLEVDLEALFSEPDFKN